jgi:hypothetical protein
LVDVEKEYDRNSCPVNNEPQWYKYLGGALTIGGL